MRASHGWLARTGLAFVFAAGGVLGAASPAFATDCGSLQAALTAAQNGDTVTLDEGSVCTGPYTLPNASITLRGGGSGATLQGVAGARAISGVDIGTTRLTNLTIKQGGGAGGGGAMIVTGDSAPTLDHVTFLANSTTGGPGGALFIDTSATSGTVTIDTVTFGDGTAPNQNAAATGGGGLAIDSATNVVITNSQFKANVTDGSGGGGALVTLTNGADLAVTDSAFSANTAQGDDGGLGGGGLSVEPDSASTVSITGTTFQDNQLAAGSGATAAAGGALELAFAPTAALPTATLSGNTFRDNAISGGNSSTFDPRGGALSSTGVIVNSKNDHFYGNSVPSGQPVFARGVAVALTVCPDSGNAQNAFEQDVVAGNTAAASALGSIYTSCGLLPTTLRLRQTTIAGNQTGGGTSGIWGGPNDTLISENSIVGQNTGGFTIVGFPTRNATFTLLCVGGNPILGVGNKCEEPRLADPAAGDISQTASSPSVDAGSNNLATGLTTDFEGEQRTQDGDADGVSTVDMGADERPRSVACEKLSGDFAYALPGAAIRLVQGSTCTGSYTLPSVPITLAGDGAGATFAPSSGRALYGTDVGVTVMRNLTFRGGSGSPGGAVLLDGASAPTIDTVTFLDNHSADVGGALAIFSTGTQALMTITDTRFGDGTAGRANTGTKGGGAAIYPGSAALFMKKTTFEANEATGGAGGGLYLASGSGFRTLESVAFTGNTVTPEGGYDGRGGGAWIGASPASAPVRLVGPQFTGNTIKSGVGSLAGAGLAIVGTNPDDRVEQLNSRFTGNTFEDPAAASSLTGAGESVVGAKLVSHEDRFVANTVGAHGNVPLHGIALALEGCNTGFGGTTHSMANDVIVSNAATGDAAGAIYVSCAAAPVALNILNSTIMANSAGGTSAIFGDADETLAITNSIVMDNGTGAELTGFNAPAVTYSDMCANSSPVSGTGNICADPKLVDAASGDVDQTQSSPTVDVGSNAAVPPAVYIDYKGNDRILDSDKNGSAIVDMGADEKLPPAPQPIVLPPVIDLGFPPVGGTPPSTAVAPETPSEQIVAGVKQTSTPKPKPKAKKCGDRTGPTSRFLNRLSKAAVFKGGTSKLLIRGMARYKKCKGGKKGTIKRVNFTIKLVEGKQCRFLTKAASLGPPMSCKKKSRLFRAKGTTKWSYTLRGPLPAGKYLAQVQAVDNLGNSERASSHRNFRHFRIEGTRLRQGWNGTHPDDYTKRG